MLFDPLHRYHPEGIAFAAPDHITIAPDGIPSAPVEPISPFCPLSPSEPASPVPPEPPVAPISPF